MLELELSYEGKILDCEYSLRLQPNGRIAGESAREPELTATGAFLAHSGEFFAFFQVNSLTKLLEEEQ